MQAIFDELLMKVVDAVQAVYAERLMSIVLFGSVARGTMRHDSDLDLLIVARDLPHGRLKRVEEFEAIEHAMTEDFRRSANQGVHTTLAPILKTPDEVLAGSPLFLDMVEDARVLHDQDGFFSQVLARLQSRLAELGAKRIWQGNAWHWDLKPDFTCGEVFEL